MKVLAQGGHGVACVPTTIEREVARQHGLKCVGRVAELAEPLYLVEPLHRRPHPLVAELAAFEKDGSSRRSPAAGRG